MLLKISYNDHVTNEEVCRKIQVDIGEYDEILNPGQETQTKMATPQDLLVWQRQE